MTITFGGLATGIDTNAIITQLVALQRRPIQILQGQRAEQNAKLNLLGTLEGLVNDLQSKAQDLSSSSAFLAYDLQVGTEGVADFTVTGDATAGGHQLKVFSLASQDRYSYDGVADPAATGLGGGTITFDYYDTDTETVVSHTVTVTAGTDSLNDVASAINNQAGDAVEASVINTGTSANPSYELVLSGKDTGQDYAIQNLTVTGIGLTGQTQLNAATNAKVELDGLTVERSTNVFSDVLTGVSFTVTQADAANPPTTSFTIESDTQGIKDNLKEFADAYNKVIDFINGQESYSEEAGTGGLLFGDTALQTIRSTIKSAIFDVDAATLAAIQDPNSGVTTVSLSGITIDSDGRMTLDDTKIDAAISSDLGKFADLFIKDAGDPDSTTGDGAFVRLDEELDKILKDHLAVDSNGNPLVNPSTGEQFQIDGLFNRRKNTLNDLIGDIDDQVTRLEDNLVRFEDNLVQRFASLEKLIGKLNAQSAYLNSGNAFPS
ncbi:MAG TPA: hypothetical protein ENJ09_11100 [Planctomycetes bacterium]|nr:hypothetical protein [Planctomycetota bacterium]